MKPNHIRRAVSALAIVATCSLQSSCAPKEDEGSGSPPPGESTSGGGELAPGERLSSALANLRKSEAGDAAVIKQSLAELESYLRSLPKEEAVAAMTASLDAGEDTPFPISFEIGEGGFLAGHPSWRVALLDWLGKIDPQAAAAYAEQVLETPTAADEWAIALRNYARGNTDPDSFPFLREKVEEMIDYPEWRTDPSVGFLESFDVFVHTGAVESTPKLSSLVGDRSAEGRALAHAAFLTLDRLTLAKPEEMFTALAAEERLFETRGPMLGNLYARADLRDAAQRQQVEAYLLDPRRSPDELNAFAGVYPNANQMISKNLLTTPQTARGAELIAHDREALVIVNGWLQDPRFADPRVRPHVETMHRRLTEFVRQAADSDSSVR